MALKLGHDFDEVPRTATTRSARRLTRCAGTAKQRLPVGVEVHEMHGFEERGDAAHFGAAHHRLDDVGGLVERAVQEHPGVVTEVAIHVDGCPDRKNTRPNSSHYSPTRMPSYA